MRQTFGVLLLIAAVLVVSAAAPRGGGRASLALASGNVCTPARPHASGTTVQTVSTPGGSRTYRLHVPPSYTGSDPVPFVFSIHGAGSNGTEQEVYSAFST